MAKVNQIFSNSTYASQAFSGVGFAEQIDATLSSLRAHLAVGGGSTDKFILSKKKLILKASAAQTGFSTMLNSVSSSDADALVMTGKFKIYQKSSNDLSGFEPTIIKGRVKKIEYSEKSLVGDGNNTIKINKIKGKIEDILESGSSIAESLFFGKDVVSSAFPKSDELLSATAGVLVGYSGDDIIKVSGPARISGGSGKDKFIFKSKKAFSFSTQIIDYEAGEIIDVPGKASAYGLQEYDNLEYVNLVDKSGISLVTINGVSNADDVKLV